jgi:hypothetical protein
MDKKDFNKYKTSFNQYQFKDIVLEEFMDDIKNPYYYDYFIDNWYIQRLQELNKNKALKERVELLRDFLLNLRFLMFLIIEFYKVIKRCNSIDSGRINRVRIKNTEVLTMLETIEEIKISIQLNDEKGKNDLATIIRNYCLSKLDEVKLLFRNNLHINIDKSPLKKEFSKVVKSIKKSTNYLPNKNPIITENPYPKIFINVLSYQIFKKYYDFGLVNPYKDLSFLFQQLKSEKKRLLSIKHLEFAEWLLKEEFITEKVFIDISNKKGFDSKSNSAERLNKYFNIVNELETSIN